MLMSIHSEDAERFLLAAKRAEIDALQRLSRSCELVTTVSDLVHHLQRERGISNIYLVSEGNRFGEQRTLQLGISTGSEQHFRQLLHQRYLNAGETQNMRLLNSIAYTLHGLDDLPALREKIGGHGISALEATSAYCRLIAGLLAVVFEAAEVADDPEVTRLLVALFNFMQAKEFAGQERAWGAMGFARSHFDVALHDRLRHLQECQIRNIQVFAEYAGAEALDRWHEIEESQSTLDLQRLRQVIAGLEAGQPIAADISEVWYQMATARIDRMHELEDAMAGRLLKVSRSRVAQAQSELGQHYARLQVLKNTAWPPAPAATLLFDPDVPGLIGDDSVPTGMPPLHSQKLAQSLYDLIRDQVNHIRRVSDELEETRRALNERKLVERAKGVLMRRFRMSEEQAYRTMQQRAMAMNMKLAEVAAKILEIGEREIFRTGTLDKKTAPDAETKPESTAV